MGWPVTTEEDSNGTQKVRQRRTGTRGEAEAENSKENQSERQKMKPGMSKHTRNPSSQEVKVRRRIRVQG